MRCSSRARLALALALLCAAAPVARADPPLGPVAPCKTAQEVIDAMAFDISPGFSVAKGCESLCKKARATCAQYVNRAITCERKNVEDSSFFKIKVECAHQPLKTCDARPGLEADRTTKLDALQTERETALGECDTKAQACTEICNAP
jgi:hypothetical protein